MDFEPTDRQKHWRDRVRHFIENHVRPRDKDYKAQQAESESGEDETPRGVDEDIVDADFEDLGEDKRK